MVTTFDIKTINCLMQDATGSWSLSYHFVGILSTIVVSLWLLERPISYVWCGYVKPVINTIDEFTVNSEMGVNGSNLEMPVPHLLTNLLIYDIFFCRFNKHKKHKFLS
jgi:hypothetical protein